ncbi:MAG: hypothetical protein CME62_00740 [Halobacteriovoraceae bacterium]|nr:hypothetical protein [Halobacteriovoraceae bacterium]|tara:strand:+ start:11147 stop:11350 length:204 start_codon:yes stop_codon:yes gene_type:complete
MLREIKNFLRDIFNRDSRETMEESEEKRGLNREEVNEILRKAKNGLTPPPHFDAHNSKPIDPQVRPV